MSVVDVEYRSESTLDTAQILSDVADLALHSFNLESKREESLILQSSQMLTAFSFGSAALLMLVPIMLGIKNLSDGYVLFSAGIKLMLLIVSMVLALLVQWRYKYQTLPAPLEIFSHVNSNLEYFSTSEQRYKNRVEMLEDVYKSKKKINDLRIKLITHSIIFFLLPIGILFLEAVVGLTILCFKIKIGG